MHVFLGAIFSKRGRSTARCSPQRHLMQCTVCSESFKGWKHQREPLQLLLTAANRSKDSIMRILLILYFLTGIKIKQLIKISPALKWWTRPQKTDIFPTWLWIAFETWFLKHCPGTVREGGALASLEMRQGYLWRAVEGGAVTTVTAGRD